jgi:hypothetical protein
VSRKVLVTYTATYEVEMDLDLEPGVPAAKAEEWEEVSHYELPGMDSSKWDWSWIVEDVE